MKGLQILSFLCNQRKTCDALEMSLVESKPPSGVVWGSCFKVKSRGRCRELRSVRTPAPSKA